VRGRNSVLSLHLIGNTTDNWARILLDPQELDDLLELRNFRLIEIEHRKNEESPYHEFVQVTVQCTTIERSTHIRYARVDRSFQRNPASVRNHYRNLLRGSSLPADDTIFITPTPHRAGSFSMFVLYFDYTKAPTILDLANVLQAVTSSAPNYNLDSMCYWFARMVFDGLAEAFGGQILPGQKPGRRGKFTWGIELVERGGSLRLTGLPYLTRARKSPVLPTREVISSEIHRLRKQLEKEWKCVESGETPADRDKDPAAAAELGEHASRVQDNEVQVFSCPFATVLTVSQMRC